MIKKPNDHDRDGILGTLARFGCGKVAPPAETVGKGYVPPSRKHRKSITTWQEEAVLKQLKGISHEKGIPQQVLIAWRPWPAASRAHQGTPTAPFCPLTPVSTMLLPFSAAD